MYSQVSRLYSDNKLNIPNLTNSKEEYIISSICIVSIIDEKYGLSENNSDFSDLLIADFGDIASYMLSILESVSNNIKKKLIEIMRSVYISDSFYDYLITEDRLGTILQKSFSAERRKELAVNYTVRSGNLLSKLLTDRDLSVVKKMVDPFCGSGRLITSIMETGFVRNLEFIMINDIVPAAVLLAYFRIQYYLKYNNLISIQVKAVYGDGFDLINHNLENEFDLVITNPPFTRSQLISKSQRKTLDKLLKLSKSYDIGSQGQAGLHIFSIFLADNLLNSNGIMLSVLPTSTILSRYSIGVQELLLGSYKQFELISSKTEKSFSEDSIFRELILIASRKGEQKFEFKLLDEKSGSYINEQLIDKNTLHEDWNWDRYFRSKNLLELRNEILPHLSSGDYLDLDILRGVELYGPDFYFFPNRFWKVTEDNNNEIIIQNIDTQTSISKKFLVKVLRQPKLYKQISPPINEYALSINQEPSLELSKYIDANIENAKPARKRFGDRWLNHIHDQIKSKNPVGHLFIIDKFSLATQAMLVHYTDEKLHCTKNFYIIRADRKKSKLLSAWMNSTIYISLYLTSRREIGGSFGRLQIIDYKEEKLFPKFIHEIDYSHTVVKEIFSHFDKLRKEILPPVIKQINEPYRLELDQLFIKLFEIYGGPLNIEIKQVHSDVRDELNELFGRDYKR